jgi:hypothetical protein
MSLFADLKKCDNKFCQRYIYEKDKGRYKYKDLSLCSLECAHTAALAFYVATNKDKFDMNTFLEQIRKEFEEFREALSIEYVITLIKK